MATFVLVHGAWIGAWRHFARELRRAGHDVYTPTLTGLGDRRHLAHPDIDVETHVTDVTNVLELEDLRDVVLAGHSYSGIVVTCVADRQPQRVGQLVYVDAGILRYDESLFSTSGSEYQETIEQVANAQGDGWRVPMPPPAYVSQFASMDGLEGATLEEFVAKAAPQPIKTFSQRVTLAGSPDTRDIPRAYIHCTSPPQPEPLPWFVEEAQRGEGWRYLQLPTGHWPMLSMPRELAGVLASLAEDRS